MTEFTIDCLKWRCGMRSEIRENRLGKGETNLLNKEGFQCCLGQTCSQLGVSDEHLFERTDPESATMKTGKPIDIFADDLHYLDIYKGRNTDLSKRAMVINDNKDTKVKTKMKKLQGLFKEYGHTISFKNVNKALSNV